MDLKSIKINILTELANNKIDLNSVNPEAIKVFAKMQQAAINYARCSLKLPTKEEELLRLEKDVLNIGESNINLYKKEGYVSGYCDGFRLHSHWLNNR